MSLPANQQRLSFKKEKVKSTILPFFYLIS
jgi:hypothetical protein